MLKTTTYTSYTYLIGWSQYNKWYYGVRYSKKSNPTDLWNGYFTSSKYVKEFRKSYGEPDIIEVRKTFKSKESAILWETKVLKKLKVIETDKWLNKNDSCAPPIYYGENHPNYRNNWSDEQKEKQSEKLKGKTKGVPKSLKHRLLISYGLKNQSFEFKQKRSINARGSLNSNAKLTEKDVSKLLQEYHMNISLPKVGEIGKNNRPISYNHIFSVKKSKDFGVSIDTIKHILNGRTWKHLNKSLTFL